MELEDLLDEEEALIDAWWEDLLDDPQRVWEMNPDRLRLYVGTKAILERYRQDTEEGDGD